MEPAWNGPQVTMIRGNPYNLGTPIEYVPSITTMNWLTINHHHESPTSTIILHHEPPWYATYHIPMLSIIFQVIFRVISPSATSRISATPSTGKRPREVETANLFNMGMNQKITVVSTLWMSTELAIEWDINEKNKWLISPNLWRNLELSKFSPKLWSSSANWALTSGFPQFLPQWLEHVMTYMVTERHVTNGDHRFLLGLRVL